LQTFSPDKFVPTVWPDNLAAMLTDNSALQNVSPAGVPLFRVERGVPRVDAAVSVIDSEAEYFFIPRPQHGSQLRDRSLEVLALAQDVLNSAVSKQALPPPSTFLLAPAP
jgi:hypothetical protein